MKKIFLILFLIISTFCNSVAQKTATVKSFTLTTDHISSSDRRKDLNGNLCALVKVQVVDNIERIEGNKIGNIVKHGVENWVYMCKGSRNMRIHLQNHLPVKVIFQDYKINGLESNRVYELVLEIPDAPIPELFAETSNSSAEQKLTLNYTPEHAMVLIDSKPYHGNGHIELQLPVGEHSYIIAAEGYITAESTVKLNEHAPRVITEVLAIDNSAAPISQNNENQPIKTTKKQRVKKEVAPKQKKPSKTTVKNINTNGTQESKQENKKTKITENPEVKEKATTEQNISERTTVASIGTNAASDSKPEYKEQDTKTQKLTRSKKTSEKTKPLNKTISYTYNGVTFKCKVKNGSATIIGFDVKTADIVIPAQVIYNDISYPVTVIDTNINGYNYSTKRLVIPEGVEIIESFAFSEFRKLESVTIPNSIVRIRKNAFRNNPDTKFYLPTGIDETKLRAGKTILTR